jgi:hypothetical protein
MRQNLNALLHYQFVLLVGMDDCTNLIGMAKGLNPLQMDYSPKYPL